MFSESNHLSFWLLLHILSFESVSRLNERVGATPLESHGMTKPVTHINNHNKTVGP
ncbi:hypothetical protein Hanom_Chr10g00949821 [Helianthus anomalus]